MKNLSYPIIASVIAIAFTTIMDFTGFTVVSAFPLLLLSIVFWILQKNSKTELGLRIGSSGNYSLALLYPFLVLGAAIVTAFLFKEIQMKDFTEKNFNSLVGGVVIGPIMVLLTEEGFFRGWLWASFKRAGLSKKNTLYATTAVFVLWHISAVTSGTEYGLPFHQVPVYLVNATLLGLIWGSMRLISGSVFVPAVCHAVWNVLAYELFGYGTKTGLLGIEDTIMFGPEVGFLGIALNGAFFFWIWNRYKKKIQGA